jgi:tetratricopeptide (TPR) repeat protein
VLHARVVFSMRGDGEIFVRSVVRTLPRAKLKEFVTELASGVGIEGDIADVETGDPADTKDPFRVSFTMRAKGFLDWAAAQSRVKVPLVLTASLASDKDREGLHHLFLGSPTGRRLHASIELPAGYEATPPQPVRVSRAGVTYTASYKVDGRRLIADRASEITARDIPESAFGEYAAVVTATEADTGQRFLVRGTVSGIPAIPADMTADEAYKAGRSAWDAHRYDAAAALYKRSTELAPKMGDAWIALGLAYNKLDKADEAVAALQKQIDLDPYNKRVYSDLGAVLRKAGRKDEAIKAYTHQTELNALDGDAFRELGVLYLDAGRTAEALAPLEKASALLPRNAWIHADLVSAYLKSKQPDKARQAVDRLIDAKPGPDAAQYAAWQMAEHEFDLTRAEDLARASEKEYVARFSNLTLQTITDQSFSDLERLAWAWDAIGWIDFQRGKLTEADAYVSAAWQIIGDADVAFHFGQINEKRGKLADALSYYLTAQALSSKPTADVIAHVKKLAGGGDLPKMLESARQSVPIGRSFPLRATARGTAAYLVIVDGTRKAVDARFAVGSADLKGLEAQIKTVALPVLFPTDAPIRIPLGLGVACTAAASDACHGFVDYPKRVKVGSSE